MDSQTVSPDVVVSGADLFLGDVQLRELLAAELDRQRNQRRLSERDLDEICRFGEPGFPSCKEYLKDSSKLTGYVYSIAAMALGLGTETVLKTIDNRAGAVEARRRALLQQAEEDKVEMAANGTGRVDVQYAATVYGFIKALHSLR